MAKKSQREAKRIAVELDPATLAQLNKYAEEHEILRTKLVRELIFLLLDDRIKLVIRNQQIKGVSLNEIKMTEGI